MKSELLSAVLVDDDAFRAATLRQTLTLARRRRRARVARRVLGVASLLSVIAFLLRPSVPISSPLTNESPAFVVRTAPLAPSQRVRTKPKLFAPVVSTSTGLALVTSEQRVFLVIETRTAAPKFDLLSDQQLLTGFPGDRRALVAHGTAEARLVFY